MKTLTIFTLILLSFSGYCQKVKYDLKEVPKQTNKIIIANSKTFEENYIYVGRILVQNGYGIKSSNKEFGQFETAPKEMNRRRGCTAFFNIVIADSLIKVSGQYCVPISIGFGSGVSSEPTYSEIRYLGKGFYDPSFFYEMIDIAMKFGNSLKYEIQ